MKLLLQHNNGHGRGGARGALHSESVKRCKGEAITRKGKRDGAGLGGPWRDGKGLVRKTYRYRDEPGGEMQTAIESYQGENWKTDVRAWDWRTRWERDGTIRQYPMTRQWLKRVRGEGPINVVD